MVMVSRLLLLGCLMAAPYLATAQECPASRLPALSLKGVRTALDANSEITIVAFGSSSTAGWHSSDIAHSYPAILQAELSAALPQAHIAVLNRGVGGQDAAEMMPRLERDVLGPRPNLVIWQVGANGAMRNADPDEFQRMVTAGVRRLQRARTDVVLMDNQRAPQIMASPAFLRIDQALAETAELTGAGLFARSALMDQWQRDGRPYREFVSDDGIHHNDFGYRCVAKALASAILRGLGIDLPIQSAAIRR